MLVLVSFIVLSFSSLLAYFINLEALLASGLFDFVLLSVQVGQIVQLTELSGSVSFAFGFSDSDKDIQLAHFCFHAQEILTK